VSILLLRTESHRYRYRSLSRNLEPNSNPPNTVDRYTRPTMPLQHQTHTTTVMVVCCVLLCRSLVGGFVVVHGVQFTTLDQVSAHSTERGCQVDRHCCCMLLPSTSTSSNASNAMAYVCMLLSIPCSVSFSVFQVAGILLMLHCLSIELLWYACVGRCIVKHQRSMYD
jgi:hypothetical protein